MSYSTVGSELLFLSVFSVTSQVSLILIAFNSSQCPLPSFKIQVISYVQSRNISTPIKKSFSNTHRFFPCFHLLFCFKIQKFIIICPGISTSPLAVFQSQNANTDVISRTTESAAKIFLNKFVFLNFKKNLFLFPLWQVFNHFQSF